MSTYVVGIDGSETAAKAAARAGALAKSTGATVHVVSAFSGGRGTVVGFGFATIGPPATATAKPFTLASTTLDTTAAQAITATATWSVANAGNQARLDGLTVRRRAA